ncbi:hypothetical protein QYS49_05475 [Marivirga salinae]|uniref:Uncharacterized protein n=1 Tax=Marivirga salinarum TaxID=3059078 RepID=A0AA49GCK7_9BACT|nr:hypothetical protein [Marivirga sp. BDSF4-3]WKK76732.2 hypothetical protein QYS49_05475 [Marivirga sp. BDSF4-3]
MELKFDIFIPDKRKQYSISDILGIVAMILAILILILNHFFTISQTINQAISGILFTVMLYYFVRAVVVRGKIQPLKGKLMGQLKFGSTEIFINDQKIDLDQINKLEFIFGNYYSQFKSAQPIFDPYSENGTSNWMTLCFNKKKHSIQFRRMYNGQEKYLKPLLEYLHFKDKISFLRLTEILGINKFEEIQEYKLELENKFDQN